MAEQLQIEGTQKPGFQLPHERLSQLNRDAVEKGYDVEEMERLFGEYQEEIQDYTDSQIFTHHLSAERLRGICRAVVGYLAIEQASRE